MPVERFKALFSSGKNKGKYKAVSRSSYDNDEPREAFVDDEIISLRRTVWHLAASLAIVVSALFFTLAYIVANGSHNHEKCHGSVERIGSDPNGFVPPGKKSIPLMIDRLLTSTAQRLVSRQDGRFWPIRARLTTSKRIHSTTSTRRSPQ